MFQTPVQYLLGLWVSTSSLVLKRSLNCVQLFGQVSQDSVMRQVKREHPATVFSLAINEVLWSGETEIYQMGDVSQKATWHRTAAFWPGSEGLGRTVCEKGVFGRENKRLQLNAQIKNNWEWQAKATSWCVLSDPTKEGIEWMILLQSLFGRVSFPNKLQSLSFLMTGDIYRERQMDIYLPDKEKLRPDITEV